MLEAAAFINIIDVTMWLCRIEAYRGPGSTRHNNMGLHTLEGDSSRISDLSPGYTDRIQNTHQGRDILS